MLEQLYQTISSFFFDLPSIKELIDSVKTGDTDILGGFVSMIMGVVARFSGNSEVE